MMKRHHRPLRDGCTKNGRPRHCRRHYHHHHGRRYSSLFFLTLAIIFGNAPSDVTTAAAFVPGARTVTKSKILYIGSNNVESESSSSGGGGTSSSDVILRSDNANLLNFAFDALKEEDKYDAVLTGLCAKMLDGKDADNDDKMNDVMDLVKEMNARKVNASVRSISALVDAGAKSESPQVLSEIMSLSIRNGAISRYGSLQNTITIPPSSSAQTLSLPTLPVDNRITEIGAAAAFAVLVGGSLLVSQDVGSGVLFLGVGPEVDPGVRLMGSLVFYGMIGTVIVDNFYDGVLGLGKFVNLAAKKEVVGFLPSKDNLPLGLGKGELTGLVGKGFTRLLSVDTERECQSEAAAFFAAYNLGLPCFAFRPNALEAAVLVVESIKDDKTNLSTLFSNTGLLKVLIWLLAPVAFEQIKHKELLVSDPRESPGFLKRLRDNASCPDLGEILDDEDVLLRWAYREAQTMMRENKRVVENLAEGLASGAATVGDCVGVIEGWVE